MKVYEMKELYAKLTFDIHELAAMYHDEDDPEMRNYILNERGKLLHQRTALGENLRKMGVYTVYGDTI